MESQIPNWILIVFWSIIVYMIGLCFVLNWSETNKFLKIIQRVYLWPANCLIKLLPFYQHYILNFLIVLSFPFAIIIIILKGLAYLDILQLNGNFIFFTALTISAILSLSNIFGQLILEIVGLGKIYRRSKLDDSYNAKNTKFLMYLIYFLFLFISFACLFYNDGVNIPEVASASFMVYLAADQLLTNKHLSKIKTF